MIAVGRRRMVSVAVVVAVWILRLVEVCRVFLLGLGHGCNSLNGCAGNGAMWGDTGRGKGEDKKEKWGDTGRGNGEDREGK